MIANTLPKISQVLILLVVFCSSSASLAADPVETVRYWPLVSGLGVESCGELFESGRHGPYDYRHPPPQAIIHDVEKHHFTQRLKAMHRGRDEYIPSAGTRGGDAGGKVAGGFSYTLHAFPNHARALQALDLYSRKKGFDEKPPGAERTVECYFERAIRYVPNDITVRFLYADYLEARGRKDEAIIQINLISKGALDHPMLAYNVGLFYARREEMDKALEYARVAYLGGFALPGLKALLLKSGKWDATIDQIKRHPSSK